MINSCIVSVDINIRNNNKHLGKLHWKAKLYQTFNIVFISDSFTTKEQFKFKYDFTIRTSRMQGSCLLTFHV